MAISDDVEAEFRIRMRALAQKGGAVTKQRSASDPGYYRRIGRLGGRASVAARKVRIIAELSEGPTVEPPAPAAGTTLVCGRLPMTLSQALADLESSGLTMPDAGNCRQSPADLRAERNTARLIARIRRAESGENDPWDPWR